MPTASTQAAEVQDLRTRLDGVIDLLHLRRGQGDIVDGQFVNHEVLFAARGRADLQRLFLF